MFRCTVTRDQALDAVRAWWGDSLMARDLANRARIDDFTSVYFPFWMLTAHVVGSVKGYRIDDSSEFSDTKVPVDLSLDSDLVWTGTACDPGDLGIYYLRNLVGETVPRCACTERVPEVTVPQAQALSNGRNALEFGAVRYASVPIITAHEVHLRHLESSLVVYPFWVVRYVSGGRTYFATVDGVTGDLASGRAPGNLFWRCFAFVAAMAVSILAVMGGIYDLDTLLAGQNSRVLEAFRDMFPFLLPFIGLMPFVLLYGAGLVIEAFIFARYGSEITYGEVKGGYRISSEHRPSTNGIALAGVFFGFAFMVLGGLMFYNWGFMRSLGPTLGGFAVYIISCISAYRWETVRSVRIGATPVEEKET